jgi:hypothetical protein
MQKMKYAKALISGLIGTGTAALLHRGAREVYPEAPRVDILGIRIWSKMLRKADIERPSKRGLYWITAADAAISGSLFYGMVGLGSRRGSLARGAMLGTISGAAGIALPSVMNVPSEPVTHTRDTQIMTIALGLIGGLAAAAAYNILDRRTAD